MTNKPKRLTTKIAERPKDNKEFKFPEAKIDLEFFLKKGHEKYSPEQVIGEMFGEEGFSLTPQEKVYNVLKALEDLEFVMPFAFECPNCGSHNTVAVEVAKVMTTEGTPKKEFTIEFDDFIFKFERPDFLQETPGESLADVGMFIMQWLVGTNQGPNFEFIHLKLKDILELARRFSEEMFKVNFRMETSCHQCQYKIEDNFGVSLEDLTELINEL